jgi:uncharacterized Zn-binding protein involved in type VI secretion
MGFSVGIHPPKTPITKSSGGVAKNTIPNVCKMPGPPAPFIPTPLPNIAKSERSPKKYSKTVKIEGNTVAIRGSTFESIGDMASKGTGGGLVSANTHGPAKFITPGSMTVKIEGKAVHLKGEQMLNNCGASGSPPNTGATMMGADNPDSKAEKCPPHDWRIISKKTPDEAKKDNTAEAQRLRKKGKRDVRQAETLEFENKAIDHNMKKMNIQYCQVKIKCNDCGEEGEIDILGDEQIGESQSTTARNLDTGSSGRKKSAQAKRLNDCQNQMNEIQGTNHQPKAKMDQSQIGDEDLATRTCNRRNMQPEFI